MHTRLMANGLEIGVQEVNRTPKGVRIRLDRVGFDPPAKPQALVAGLVKRGVTAIVLPCHPDLQASIAAAANRRLLMLAPCDSNAATAERVAGYWTVGMVGTAEAVQLANFAALQNGTSAMILSSPRSRYSTTFSGYFRTAAKRRGIAVVGEASMRLDARDIAGVVAAVNKTKPRVIFAGLYSPYSERFVLKLRKAGVRTPVYLPSGTDVPLSFARYGAAMKDVTFTSFGFPRPNATKRYVDAYRKRFRGDVYGSYPGIGFETARVLQTALGNSRSNTWDALDRAFTKGFRTTGVAATDLAYAPENGRHPTAEVGLARIIRGEYVPVVASVPADPETPPAR